MNKQENVQFVSRFVFLFILLAILLSVYHRYSIDKQVKACNEDWSKQWEEKAKNCSSFQTPITKIINVGEFRADCGNTFPELLDEIQYNAVVIGED